MPLEIRSTRFWGNGLESARGELVISDNAEEDKVVESLHICTRVPLRADPYLPALQAAAMKRAVGILDETNRVLREQWNSQKT